ncbi:MAG: HlyD family efflux transporter periplasmic adaptor subunit [Pseudomonadota bacterium]
MNDVSIEPTRQSLGDALQSLFASGGTAPFPKRLVAFTQALVPGARAWVLSPTSDDGWTSWPEGSVSDQVQSLASTTLGDANQTVQVDGRCLGAPVCLDTGVTAALVIDVQQGGQAALALAFERLSLLSQLTFARHRPDALVQLQRILSLLPHLKGPSSEAAQELADALAHFMSADYAAVAQFDGVAVSELHISGQITGKRNAALPAALQDKLAETARLRLCTSERAFSGGPTRSDGIVFHLENPSRNKDILPLIAAATDKVSPSGAHRGARWKSWTRRAAIVCVLAGICFIPIPDGVDVSATVAATSQRVVTSPLDAPVLQVNVRGGDSVTAGDTVLARFDTREIDLELIAAQAAYTKALLDRERARASRLAAELRTAEIEADRLSADIELLQARKQTAELVAPITGIVLGEGLADLTGAILRRGDPVLQIADPTSLELDLAVPQSQIARLDLGAEGVFRPDFDPSLRFNTEVTVIFPAASSAERNPVYPAQAMIEGQTMRLKPGMTGVVALNRTWRPIGQVVWRELRNWVLLRIWI